MKVIKVRVSDEEMDVNAAKKMPFVKKAIASAKSVLSIFEKEYPGDKGPRKAIAAAEAWMKNPTGRNRVLAGYASEAAASAVAAYSVAKSESATTEAAGYAAAYAAGAAASATVEAASSDASKAIVKAAKAK